MLWPSPVIPTLRRHRLEEQLKASIRGQLVLRETLSQNEGRRGEKKGERGRGRKRPLEPRKELKDRVLCKHRAAVSRGEEKRAEKSN